MTNENKPNQDLESLAKASGPYEEDVYALVSKLLKSKPDSYLAWRHAAYFTQNNDLRERYIVQMGEVVKKDNTPEAYVCGIFAAKRYNNSSVQEDLNNEFKQKHPAEYAEYIAHQSSRSLMSIVARFFGLRKE
jgi:hypothetical protein